MNDDARKAVFAHSHERWEHLTRTINETAVEGMKYLTVVNVGGVAATLGFMGATKRSSVAMTFAAALFLLGACCVGGSYLFRYVYTSRLLARWQSDFEQFVGGRISWEDVTKNDRRRTTGPDYGLYFAIASFLAFILGAVLGFVGVR